MLVELDIFYGEPKLYKVAMKPNAKSELDRNAVRLLAALPVRCHSWLLSHGGGHASISSSSPARNQVDPGSTVILFHAVPFLASRYNVYGEDAQGNTERGSERADTGHVVLYTFERKLDTITSLVLSESPSLLRIRYALPGIPGMPEANFPDVAPLDRVVPLARFGMRCQLEDLIEATTGIDQLHWDDVAAPTINDTVELRNVTARQLLDRLVAGQGAVYQIGHDRIVIRPNFRTRWKRRVRGWGQRMF